jgi:uncharacterized caspase-like protein
VRALALPYGAKDAWDLAEEMKKQKGELYEDVAAELLTDAAATKEAILQGLKRLSSRTRAQDVCLVFLTGYEARGSDGDIYYLAFDTDPKALEGTALPASTIRSAIHDLAGRTVMLLDSCHHIEESAARSRWAEECGGIVSALAPLENRVVAIATASGEQHARDNDTRANGAFCRALLDGIEGKADYTRDGRISINELDVYIRKSVKSSTGGLQLAASSD